MQKLSMSVNGNKDIGDQNGDDRSASLSITKKVSKPEDISANDSNDQTVLSNTVEYIPSNDAPAEASAVARWLIQTIGIEVFDEVKSNPELKLPYVDDGIDTSEWLSRIIKTYFTQDNINTICNAVLSYSNHSEKVDEKAVDKIVEERMAEKIEKFNNRFHEMQSRLEDAQGEAASIKRSLNTALPLDKFINTVFRNRGNETEPQKRMIQALNESAQSDEDVSDFIINFSKGWMLLNSVVDNLPQDEKQALDLVHAALSKCLEYLSNCYISERRTILDYLASHVSSYFASYDFISPEQTLNIDPEIHNAGGMGNARIKEGISFAVVRRDTKKTVKYADIRVS